MDVLGVGLDPLEELLEAPDLGGVSTGAGNGDASCGGAGINLGALGK